MTRKLTLAVAFLCLSNYAFPQSNEVKGGIYIPTNKIEKGFVPYTPLQERDVMWGKRIWRTMDLKEKMNHPFYFPTESYGNLQSLFSLIYNSVENNELTVYDAIDDEFTISLEKSKALSVGRSEETITFEDEFGNLIDTVIYTQAQTADIMRYRIKEQWFFDKQRSVMDVRIIGLCPIRDRYDEETDEFLGVEPLFWVYFPEARKVLTKAEVFNHRKKRCCSTNL